MYNEKVLEIFRNPHNVGEIKGTKAVGQVGNQACGDIMKIYLSIDENDIITDAKFKTFGCAAAIVSSSVATDMIIGKSIKQALKVTNEQILDKVGGFPTHKVHCSILAKEAIEMAITNYRKYQERLAKKLLKQQDQKVVKNTK